MRLAWAFLFIAAALAALCVACRADFKAVTPAQLLASGADIPDKKCNAHVGCDALQGYENCTELDENNECIVALCCTTCSNLSTEGDCTVDAPTTCKKYAATACGEGIYGFCQPSCVCSPAGSAPCPCDAEISACTP